jgi:biotin transport system substrate-specific component
MYTDQTQSLPLDSRWIKTVFVAIIQIVCGSLFIGLGAQIEIPLYFTPVPLTGQTFAIMLVGALLGCRKGALSVILYISEGAMGLPVFSGGGFGLVHLFGPTRGYFLGFVIQAFLVGWFLENIRTNETKKIIFALLLACTVQLWIGALWLAHYVGLNHAFMLGVYPFIPGEIIKILAITAFLKWRGNK